MLLMIDNYDSFTYNLVQYFGELGETVKTVRNDEITLAEIEALQPQRIVLSPGPCSPSKAGICLDLIQHFKGRLPILGVCLGHQAIGQAFGGEVVRAKQVMHGKVSPVIHTNMGVFHQLPSPLNVTRYHSLAVAATTLPAELEITAWTEDGEVMGFRHRQYVGQVTIEGVQFHPEAILTEHGHDLLANFLRNTQ